MQGDFLMLIIGLLGGFLFGSYLPSYFKQKGQNLATKEDVRQITKEVEQVKHEYTREAEALRSQLTSQIKVSGHRYEKEYDHLLRLTDKLVDVRDAALALRPEVDHVDPAKDPQDVTQERLKRFHAAHFELYMVRERLRPFYPDTVYKAIIEVERAARLESIQYRYRDPYEGHKEMEYWDQAVKNQELIASAANNALETIRARVERWEQLQYDL